MPLAKLTVRTFALLGARYLKGTEAKPLTHAFFTDAQGQADLVSLCGKIKAESACDPDASDLHATPTCAKCAQRDTRGKSMNHLLQPGAR